MNKLFALLAAVVVFTTPVLAQSGSCVPAEDIVANLNEVSGDPVFVGDSINGYQVAVWVNPESNTFIALALMPGGTVCLLDSGLASALGDPA